MDDSGENLFIIQNMFRGVNDSVDTQVVVESADSPWNDVGDGQELLDF